MTQRLSDAEFDLALAPEPKLSRVPPGHWRIVFRLASATHEPLDAELLEKEADGCEVYRGHHRYVSRDVAETFGATRCAVIAARLGCRCEFVRADYFPGERP